jgi:Tol biopolymer transport system component
VRATALMVQMLNPRTLELEGNAVVLEPDVAPGFLGELAYVPVMSASASGIAAVVKTRNGSVGQLTWFDRTGRATGTIQPPDGGEYLNPALSPDGERLAVNRMDPTTGNWDVWIVDLVRGVSSRLTNDGALDSDPVWSPDGKSIAFASNRGGRFAIFRKPFDGTDPEEEILRFDERTIDVTPSDWSPDGQHIAFGGGCPLPVCSVEVGGAHKVAPMVTTPLRQTDVRYSPDGRWIAYGSYETGQTEIYLQRLEPPGEKILISQGGGAHPRWVSGGRELVYWAFPGGVKAVDLDFTGPRPRVGEAKTLVSSPVLSLMDSRTQFDVTRDGRRLLVRQPAGGERPAITVIVNWIEKLRK